MHHSYFIISLLVFLAVACSAPQAPTATVAAIQPTAVLTVTAAPPTSTAATVQPTAATTATVVAAQPSSTLAPTASSKQPTTVPGDTNAVDPFAVSIGRYLLDTTGFEEMATVLGETQKMDLSFRTRVARARKVLAQMPLPADFEKQGQAFNQTLNDLYLAMRDNKLEDTIARARDVSEAQQALSAALDTWLATNPPRSENVDPFNLVLAQTIIDTTGFRDMAVVLSDTQKIDPTYAGRVRRVIKILGQATFPPEVDAQVKTLQAALDNFANALGQQNPGAAVTASETLLDAQAELSRSIDDWLKTNPTKSTEANRFQTSIAQFYLDSAGLHDIAAALAKSEKIEPAYLTTVTRVQGLLEQVTWELEMDAQAQAFIQNLDALAAALRADKVQDAITLSGTVHDAQHELSHAVDVWLGGQAEDH